MRLICPAPTPTTRSPATRTIAFDFTARQVRQANARSASVASSAAAPAASVQLAGSSPAVFRRPLLAGSQPTVLDGSVRVTESGDIRVTEVSGSTRITEDTDQNRYKFWVHEIGTDEVDGIVVVPIQSFFETADIALPAVSGINKATQVLLMEPDFVQTGPMTVAVHGRANARAPEIDGDPVTFEDTAATPQDQVVTLKTQRRELRFRFESNVVGGDYQMGLVLAHVQPGDGTLIG